MALLFSHNSHGWQPVVSLVIYFREHHYHKSIIYVIHYFVE